MLRSFESVLPALVALVGNALGCSEPSEAPVAMIQKEVRLALSRADEVNVIVNLRDPAPARVVRDREDHRWRLRRARDSVLGSAHDGLVPTRQFEHVPAIAARISRSALETLGRDPNVSFIQLDETGHGALAVSVPAIGADKALSTFRVTGAGVRVAVLDTGANSGHPDLETSIASTQHCFTQSACPPDDAAEGPSAEDDHGHGSHVTGIITSDGSVAGAGFAPGAEIVAVKINDRNDRGVISDWVAGLDWVFSNLSTLGVELVNLSICTDSIYSSQSECDAAQPALASSIKNLVDAGVTLFAASGNAGSSSQLSAPACNSGVIAVGATYKSNQGRQPTSGTYSERWGSSFGNCADETTAFDQVACFTDSGARLDLVAPGAVITSDALGSQTAEYRGTSQASPTAAGVAALMLECNPELSPAEVKEILVSTGVTVNDPKNGRSYPSLRASAAVERACSASAGSGAGGAPDGGEAGVAGDAGRSATGGASASGGSAETTGGRTASGGAEQSTGGTSGGGAAGHATGGQTATGGAEQSTGGATAAGGTTTTGGATAAGANPTGGAANGTGGALSIGGARAAGGTAGGATTQASGGGQAAATGGQLNPANGGSTLVQTSSSSNDGCGCRTAGGSKQSKSAAVALTLLGIIFAGRRRPATEPRSTATAATLARRRRQPS